MLTEIAFPFTRHELAAAIVKEKRGDIRRRLRAIQDVLRGASHQEAARKAQFEASLVDSWVHLAQTGGLKAVLDDPEGAPKSLDPELVRARRSEIGSALKTELTGRQMKRLKALDAFLAGQSRDEAARVAGFQRDTLNAWIRVLLSQGISAVIHKSILRRRATDQVSRSFDKAAAMKRGLRRRTIDLASLPFNEADVAAALAEEKRTAIRQRLLALQALLHGGTSREAAKAAEANPSSVPRWLKFAREDGLTAVLTYRPRNSSMTPRVVSGARAEIAAALKRHLRTRLRSRLEAIDAVLAGERLEKAAALIYVKPNTLKGWLGQIRKHGMAAMLAKWKVGQVRHPKLDADPAVLRARAGRQRDAGKRRRLIALAYLAEGLSLNDAAVRSGISDGTVRVCLHRFQQGGIDAVNSMKSGRTYGGGKR